MADKSTQTYDLEHLSASLRAEHDGATNPIQFLKDKWSITGEPSSLPEKEGKYNWQQQSWLFEAHFRKKMDRNPVDGMDKLHDAMRTIFRTYCEYGYFCEQAMQQIQQRYGAQGSLPLFAMEDYITSYLTANAYEWLTKDPKGPHLDNDQALGILGPIINAVLDSTVLKVVKPEMDVVDVMPQRIADAPVEYLGHLQTLQVSEELPAKA